MKVRRGDVVLVEFPYPTGTGSKVRPALVVQSDRDNTRLSNTIVAQISSSIALAGKEPTHVLIDPATTEGRGSGLLQSSVVTCANLTTLGTARIRRRIGKLPPAALGRVDMVLKEVLSLR
jgi:mRNA interferase MazF